MGGGILVVSLEVKRALGSSMCRRGDNIKMDPQEAGCGGGA